jgi:hypothetical protein
MHSQYNTPTNWHWFLRRRWVVQEKINGAARRVMEALWLLSWPE